MSASVIGRSFSLDLLGDLLDELTGDRALYGQHGVGVRDVGSADLSGRTILTAGLAAAELPA